MAALLRVTDAAEWTLRGDFPGDAPRAEQELRDACLQARTTLADLTIASDDEHGSA